jgi:uncharacterized membrane protein
MWHLGSSSLFVDEVQSWDDARRSLSWLWTQVRLNEQTPPGYFVLLHGWIKYLAPAVSEFWLRFPSVIAGAGLVGAVCWLGSLVSGRRVAVVSGVLAVFSPFLFDYAQEVRVYIFAMLAITVSVAALLVAERSSHPWRWLALSAAAATAAQAAHYTAWLVLLPLAVYLLFWSPLPGRMRIVWVAVVLVAGAAWIPLLVAQISAAPNGWLGSFANLSFGHFGDIFGVPFRGRSFQPWGRSVVGAGIVIAALLVVLATNRTRQARMLVALALAPPSALLVTTLLAHDALLPRYTAVAVPFMIVVIGLAAIRLPRPLALVVIAGTLVLSLWNVRASDRPSGRYADMRGALRYVRAGYHAGDLIAIEGTGVIIKELRYYVPRALPSGAHVALVRSGLPADVLTRRAVRRASHDRAPIWFVNSHAALGNPVPPGYVQTASRQFPAVRWFTVTRVQPR